MKLKQLIKLAAVYFVTAGAALATTLTFDTLPGSGVPVPNGYGGLDWNNFYYLDGTHNNQSGYQNGTVSPDNVAYNAFADPASISVASGTFDLGAAYLTGAWNDGLQVNVKGFTGAHVLTYDLTFTVNTSGPLFAIFNFTGINEALFTTFGGIPNGNLSGGGEHLSMDNLIINEFVSGPPTNNVPDGGATFAMLGVAIVGLGALRRKVA